MKYTLIANLEESSKINIFIFLKCRGINDAACRIAREVADEGDALVAGGLSQTPSYLSGEWISYFKHVLIFLNFNIILFIKKS